MERPAEGRANAKKTRLEETNQKEEDFSQGIGVPFDLQRKKSLQTAEQALKARLEETNQEAEELSECLAQEIGVVTTER